MNSISDLAPLVGNPGLGAADEVEIDRNPLNVAAVNIFIPALEGRGVNVVGAPSPTLALAGTEFEDFFNWTSGNIDPANVANRVVETFGQDWRLADWNDVKLAWELYYWDMKDVFDRTHYLLVSRDGAYQADPGSWYFIEDHNGSKPPSFHSWDELGNHQISLGSNDEGPWGVLAVRRDFADLATASGTAQPAPTLTAAAQPAPTVQPKTGTIISADLIGALPDDLMLLGSAQHDPRFGVQLTWPEEEQNGFMLLKQPYLVDVFQAEFSFAIQEGTGADGLAFFVSETQPTGEPISFDYHGLSAANQLNGFAVEFDTYLNLEHDSSNNHVAVTQYPGTFQGPTTLLENSDIPPLHNGGTYEAAVSFDEGRFLVFLKNTSRGMQSTQVLDHYIPGFEAFEGYFGFYAATGGAHDAHVIRSFELRIPEPAPGSRANPTPTQSPERLDLEAEAIVISSGFGYTCALQNDGTPVCWGLDEFGRTSPPVDEKFESISAGDGFGCGVRIEGDLSCWGHNWAGQASAPGGQFASVSNGHDHACGLRKDGSALCWGRPGSFASVPAGERFAQISSGDAHTCGLRPDGSALCWGWDDGRVSVPDGERFVQISSGDEHTCGLRPDGSALCWGDDSEGQASPPAGEKFASISSGRRHTCALRADGSALCWGQNDDGESSPPAGERFIHISSGSSANTCGIREDGSLLCWGWNAYGQTRPPPAFTNQ